MFLLEVFDFRFEPNLNIFPDKVGQPSIFLETQIFNTNKCKSGTTKSGRNYEKGRAEYLPISDQIN